MYKEWMYKDLLGLKAPLVLFIASEFRGNQLGYV